MQVGKRLIAVLFLLCQSLSETCGFLLDTQTDAHSDGLYRCPGKVTRDRHLRVFQDKCYEFVTNHQKYWAEARVDCLTKGGELVIIDRQEIQNFLVAVLRELKPHNPGSWIGLTDKEHELHWHWVNGKALTGYSHWSHKQGHGLLHLTQDCAIIQLNDGGLWHDRECHLWPNTFPYICQYDAAPTTSTKTTTTTTTAITTTSVKTTSKVPTIIQTLLPSSTSRVVPMETRASPMSTMAASTKETDAPTETPASPMATSTTLSPCADIDCGKECPLGYSSISQNTDGCTVCVCIQ